PEAAVPAAEEYRFHPALLDACFQVLGGLVLAGDDTAEGGRAVVPVGIEGLRVHARPGERIWAHARLRPSAGDTFTGDLHVIDEDGRVLAEIEGLSARPLAPGQSPGKEPYEDWLYRLVWRREDAPGTATAPPTGGPWLVLADRSGTGEALASLLE